MSEVPEALTELDAFMAAIALAHESVYKLRQRLVDAERATATTDALLSESARIAADHAPTAAREIGRLAERWHEQGVLAPEDAGQTAAAIVTVFARVEPALRALLDRQTEIAAELRAALGE